ncbi:hypothetical protein BZG36_04450 [Bifiguratus adelaidae]|uniref:Mediator of RNA polymerase II transcription subunit 6 n=1 Tax=Bifiguratus adelaidae TaxID=1938954 RepID=A0A261XVD8_9FUNG|nr:hypothetical protein BZG36_04450 [Bifiguratus adelaidae]
MALVLPEHVRESILRSHCADPPPVSLYGSTAIMPAQLSESRPQVVTIEHPSGSSAEVYLYGATVTSWKVAGKERLFVSKQSKLDESKAIRGGVPIAFPIFGQKEGIELPQHGFARISKWEWLGVLTDSKDEVTVRFGLKDTQLTQAQRAAWPYSFRLTYTVTLTANALATALTVKNEGEDTFEINALFHTYYAVKHISEVKISNLKGYKYIDKVTKGNDVENRDQITISSEVDRVYQNVTENEIYLNTGDSIISVHKKNLKDTVVWNAWVDKAKGMADMADEEYNDYVCIEPGSVAEWVRVGVGMTKFLKPRGQVDYPEMGMEAATKALLDAGITYDAVQQAFVGFVYGDSTAGQRALYPLGMTQIPIVNVNNNCSTGSTALYQARTMVEAGVVDCAMALGFERMAPGSLSSVFSDRTNPLDHVMTIMNDEKGIQPKTSGAAQIFGNAGQAYCEKYGATAKHLGMIAEKNHRHSAKNPYSQFRDIYTLEQVMQSPKIFGPLTKLQCCPTSDGAACAIVASEKFVREHNLIDQAVEIVAQSMATDSPRMLSTDAIEWAGPDMTRRAAKEVYSKAGITAKDVQVIELHDCFSANELITYDALGLCEPGKAHELIDKGDVTYGGKYVVNPSGGLISKGHPLGATGLAQCAELCWQLRNQAGDRQVKNVKLALQHNVGLGGAVVVTLYKKANDKAVNATKALGYNPAVEARGISEQDVHKVASKQRKPPVLFNRTANTATLTLNRPHRGNALTGEMHDLLYTYLDKIASNPSIRVVILTGAGKFFCTGMDLSTTSDAPPHDKFVAGAALYERLATFPKPIIARINGPVLAGGTGLVFTTNIRIALKSAYFSLTEVKRGLIPAIISQYIVPEIGEFRAADYMLTGRRVSAEEAVPLFLTALVDSMEDLDRVTQQYVDYLLEAGPQAAAETKRLIKAVAKGGADQTQKQRVIKEVEGVFTNMLQSEEAAYGIGQFLQKKPADWDAYVKGKAIAKLQCFITKEHLPSAFMLRFYPAMHDNGQIWIHFGPFRSPQMVLDYFALSPFWDPECNNAVLRMQTQYNDLRSTEEALQKMTGVEFSVTHQEDPIYVIQKRYRNGPDPKDVEVLAIYYMITPNIYQAPNLYSIVANRLLTSLYHTNAAFRQTQALKEFHPASGYAWKAQRPKPTLSDTGNDSDKDESSEMVSRLSQKESLDFRIAMDRAIDATVQRMTAKRRRSSATPRGDIKGARTPVAASQGGSSGNATPLSKPTIASNKRRKAEDTIIGQDEPATKRKKGK